MQALEKPRLSVRPKTTIKKTQPATANTISAENNVLYRFAKILFDLKQLHQESWKLTGWSRDVGVVMEQERLSRNGHGLP